MATNITSAAVSGDRNTVLLGFDDAVSDPSETPWVFVFTPAGDGLPVVATRAELLSSVAVEVHVEQGLSGTAYTVTPTGFLDANGVAVEGSSVMAALEDNVPVRAEWDHGVLRALTRACAQECQRFAGRLATLTRFNYTEGDEDLYVESTLAWPPYGALFAGGRRFRFKAVGEDASRLRYVKEDVSLVDGIPERTLVVLDESAIPPDDDIPWTPQAEV